MDNAIYFLGVFSMLGFFLAPGGLGRWTWVFPGAFAALNLFLLFAPESLQPRQNPWVYLAVSQAPWLLLGLDLVAGGKAGSLISQTDLRPWILWPAFRLMGIGCLAAAYEGAFPMEFAFKAALGDALTALGAVALWIFYRPQGGVYRGLLLFWNTYGFLTAMAVNVRLLRAHPAFPRWGSPSLDLHQYFSSFPQAWIPLFWTPLSLAISFSIFFKLFREGEEL